MKTKAEIVQRLLEEKKIDAEEATILLMGNGTGTYYFLYPPPFYPPYTPYCPITVSSETAAASLN